MSLRVSHSLKGKAVSRRLFVLAGALLAGVAFAVPPTPKMTAKQAPLKGQVSSAVVKPEQVVSRLIVKLRSCASHRIR